MSLSNTVLIIDCGSNKTPNFGLVCEKLGVPFKLLNLDRLEPFHVQAYKSVIISGAPILLTKEDPSKYLKKLAFLKDLDVPVLGVCFGHQILGMLFGSEILKCEEDREEQKIQIVNRSTLFNATDKELVFQEDHCECITLPNDFTLIASSQTCQVEVMQHKQKKMYGVQFHPEVSGRNGVELLKKFLTIN